MKCAFLLALSLMTPALSMGGENAVVLGSSAAQSSDSGGVSGIFANANATAVIPAEEADLRQAGLLNSGGPVVVVDPGVKGGYKVYDGTTGADITKKFNSVLPGKEPPQNSPEPEQPKAAPPAPKPQPKEPPTFKKNHIGLSAGMSTQKKNTDSLEVLAANNAWTQITPTETTGRFRLFYEHYFSTQYGLGVAAGTGSGGQIMYAMGNRSLNVKGDPKTATLYFIRRFGGHFSLYLGGGGDFYSFTVDDPSNLAGAPSGPGTYKGSMVTPHGEAGMVLAAGNFSLRFALKQTLGDGTDNVTRSSGGTDYRLIVRNNKTLSYKTSGQSLASNEKYFKTDLGGFATAVTINYSFANW